MNFKMKKKIIIAVTGASGSIYAKQLLDKLSLLNSQLEDIVFLISENGKKVWEYELQNKQYESYQLNTYKTDNFFSPIASGSAGYHAMIIIPCSMGTLGKIANGTSDDLIIRAADVILKEKKTLILVLREAPYNLIHIENMKKVTLSGGIIFPASPSFYSKPGNIEEVVNTIVDRVLNMAGIEIDSYKWGNNK